MFEFIDSPEKVPVIIRILLLVFELIITFVSFKYVKKYYLDYTRDKNSVVCILFVIFTLFAISYCVSNDYYAYRYRVEMASEWGNMELVPQTIANLVEGNYDMFRLIIFGGAILCVIICSKIIKANTVLVLLLWFSFYYDRTFYARATLAAAVYFLGIFISSQKTGIYRLLGLAIALASFFFHRQMLIAISLIPFLFIKINRRNIALFSFMFLGIVTITAVYILNNSDMLSAIDNDDMVEGKINSYVESANNGYNNRFTTIGLIQLAFQYFFYYSPVVVITKAVFSKENRNRIPESLLKICNILIGVVGTATVFFIIFGQNNTFFYRTLYLSFIPSSIMLTKLYYDGHVSKKSLLNVMILSLIFHGSSWLATLINLI